MNFNELFVNWIAIILFADLLEKMKIKFLLSVIVYVFTQPLHTSKTWHKVNFYVELLKFELIVFFLLNWLPYKN